VSQRAHGALHVIQDCEKLCMRMHNIQTTAEALWVMVFATALTHQCDSST
jgi:hypothetical protein